ncbi:LysM peptidoglycan-binding domain-containing protein [Peribacillus saganii]|uniref:LysM peptidoglycan-binding domain-containing protein n=1 Tax=Peribacillus saganii TaxID=2303992 RepID=A0A372LP35_9BACI|nr:CAP domain-containing protein [Peribacillus saganii]RFU68733.1 LysM peptidoglycan-binding domain-containing protein [Peribacillus saganii]
MKKIILSFALSLALLFPTVALGAGTYKVVSGDTFVKIAAKNQVSITELIKANPQIKNPSLIKPGQTIYIPAKASETPAGVDAQVVKLVNQERAKYKLPALKSDSALARVSRFKSEDMRNKNYFSHTSPTYGSPFQMMKSFGISYRYAGENIAVGQTSAQAVMAAWMKSPGHKANILSKNFTYIGVGYAKGGSYGHYWTQQFISK